MLRIEPVIVRNQIGIAGHEMRSLIGCRRAGEDVADGDFIASDDAVAIGDADDESREVVFAGRIEAGHLGGLAADERAAIVLAGFRHALDDALGNVGLELARGEVIHEEERRGALDRYIVHAVVHQVGTHGVSNVHLEGDFQLGAHAIDARNQPGFEIFLGIAGKQAAKTSDLSDHTTGAGLMGKIFDPLLCPDGAVDV